MHNPKKVPLSYYASTGILNELVNHVVKSCAAAPVSEQALAPVPEQALAPIISSEFQTKDWRKGQIWYKTGKSNEC